MATIWNIHPVTLIIQNTKFNSVLCVYVGQYALIAKQWQIFIEFYSFIFKRNVCCQFEQENNVIVIWIFLISIKIKNHGKCGQKLFFKLKLIESWKKNGQSIFLWSSASTHPFYWNLDSRIYFSFSFFLAMSSSSFHSPFHFIPFSWYFHFVSLLFIYSNLMFRFVFPISLSKCP